MVLRLATHAMGTRFEIVLEGGDPHRLRAIGEEALHEIEEWHGRLSRFESGSFVSHINARAARAPVTLDDQLFELLDACVEATRRSRGAFDVTVGTGSLVLDRAARTVQFGRPGTRIDLGGVGKGHALDEAAGILRAHGVARALLHGGTSTVVAIGTPPGAAAWRVALGDGAGAPVAHLRDAALSVSGGQVRDGARIDHVVDPRAGAPARAARRAAVVGRSARETDIWSTALFVLGHRTSAVPSSLATLLEHDDPDGPRLDVRDRQDPVFERGRLGAQTLRITA